MTVPEEHRARTRVTGGISLKRLLRVAPVSCAVQFVWVLQISPVTPYVLDMGDPAPGPASCVIASASPVPSAAAPLYLLPAPSPSPPSYSDSPPTSGWDIADCGVRRPRTIALFVLGLWLPHVGNIVTPGSSRISWLILQVAVSLGSGPSGP